MTTLQKTIIALIFFTVWPILLYHRTYDKYIKKRLLSIGVMIIFWMFIRILKNISNNITITNLMWYAYYIPLIMIPTLYYTISKYIYNKKRATKKNFLLMCMSCILIIMTLTNNIHQFTFSIPDENGNYTHRIGYYIVCIWILSLSIISTILLIIEKNRRKKELKIYLVFLPIILGIIYTILYIKGVTFVRHTNMSVIVSILICISFETMFNLKLIPNNTKYLKIFKKSDLNIAILSDKGEIVHKTNRDIHIPKNLIDNIKNGKIDYESYLIEKINGGYVIIEKDLTEINTLKKKLEKDQARLKEQEKYAILQKNIDRDYYKMSFNNKIQKILLDNLENKISSINTKLEDIKEDDTSSFVEIELNITYCKFISNLLISDFLDEYYDNDKVEKVIKELFYISNVKDISGTIVTNLDQIKTIYVSSIYELIYNIIENVNKTNIYVLITQVKDELEIRVNIYNKELSIQNIIKKRSYEYYSEDITEEGTRILAKIKMKD